MSVSTGQPASASIFNGAFVSRTSDSSSVGRVTLNNTSYVVSGAQITNVQRYINELASVAGVLSEGDATALTYATNWRISNAQNHKQAIEALDASFDAASGHSHSGAAGAGGPISGAVITGVPLKGFFNQGVDLTGASGLSTNVSTELTGKSPSTTSTALGVAVLPPYNKVVLRYATGVGTDDEILDTLGNEVYARVTESASVWTLTYYVDLSGVQTAYSLPSTDVRWYYQELYDPMVSTPVYDKLAVVPSDNTTADVLDASETISGKVLLSNIAATSVGSTNVKGTGPRVSHEDHAHQGLHAVQEFVDATDVYGDIVLKSGTNVTITRTGQTFEFAASGGGTPGGSNTQIQYNNSGAFGGVTGLTWNGVGVAFGTQPTLVGTQPPFAVWQTTGANALVVGDSSGGSAGAIVLKPRPTYGQIQGTTSNLGAAQEIRIQSEGGALKLNSTYWPSADGTANQVLKTDGAGNGSWTTISAGANTALSNLAAVAINASLLPGVTNTISLGSTSFTYVSAYITGVDLGAVTLPSGPSGVGLITTSTSRLALATKDSAGDSKPVSIETGNAAAANNSGAILIRTGTTSNIGISGTVAIDTGEITSGTGSSGGLTVTTGNSTGPSGGVTLTIGTAGTTQGAFKFLKTGVASVAGQIWTASTTDGTGYWANQTTNKKEVFTLAAGDITNGYVDFLQVARTDSVDLIFSGYVKSQGTDYTLNYTGGAGGKTRLTWAGGFGASLIAGDVLDVKYEY